MNTRLDNRVSKIEEAACRDDIENEVDRLLEKAGTSRAEVIAEHGSLINFRNWLRSQDETGTSN